MENTVCTRMVIIEKQAVRTARQPGTFDDLCVQKAMSDFLAKCLTLVMLRAEGDVRLWLKCPTLVTACIFYILDI